MASIVVRAGMAQVRYFFDLVIFIFQEKNCYKCWTIQEVLVQFQRALSNLYIHYPNDGKDIEIIWKHITIDSLIFIENLILYFIATFGSCVEIPYLGYISVIIWGCYILALFFKLLFYFDQHPWSAVVLNDVFSNPLSHSICIFGPEDFNEREKLKGHSSSGKEEISLMTN